MIKRLYTLMAALCIFLMLNAQDDSATISLDSLVASYKELNFQTGTVLLEGGIAEIKVPQGYKYLNAEQSAYVLTELWGNPPFPTLGMLFPDSADNRIPSTWAIEISYEEDGHVKDDDAKDIDYDDLLKDMQEQTKEASKEREKQGYGTAELLGWASPPFYDEKVKKLHWAKRLKFGNSETETLNYNIRVLGRKGVLVLNAIGGMEDLTSIKTSINPILASVEFTKGNKYEDFNDDTDKIAAYGVGGLIAGGVLAKTGVLAKIGLFLAKFSKLIFLGIVAGGGAIWRFITGRRKDEDENPYAAQSTNTDNTEG